ncbi:hypothetical protein CB1_001735008 [Camelus ferus]|nr:hypothetical protein CB1_001735008 [Camelus ferus]
MLWFTSIGEFMESSMKDAGKEDSSDRKILSAVINKIVIPRLTVNSADVRRLPQHHRKFFWTVLLCLVLNPEELRELVQTSCEHQTSYQSAF